MGGRRSCRSAEAASVQSCPTSNTLRAIPVGWASLLTRYKRSMSTYRLKNLLAPHSVALIGGSPRHGSVGRAILDNIRKTQFKGQFGLVNPRYPEIEGVATVDS